MDASIDAKILIVDDQEYNVSLLERILTRAGFRRIHSTLDPHEVQRMVAEVEPDIVLLDLHMPGIDGLEVLKRIREQVGQENYLPVLMLTADTTAEVKQQGLQAGVNDFLAKPYDRTEVVLRIRNLLKTRELHLQLQHHNRTLEDKVQERTMELSQAKLEMMLLLGRAAEYRDDMTGQHTQRVGELSALIAERLGLPEKDVDLIRKAAPLHDIGKIGIPDSILSKEGKLTDEEFRIMRGHVERSIEMIRHLPSLDYVIPVVLAHHERFDGRGYPRGISGESIPIGGRCLNIVDSFDAMISRRSYKETMPVEAALKEIRVNLGKQFDPELGQLFISLVESGQINVVSY